MSLPKHREWMRPACDAARWPTCHAVCPMPGPGMLNHVDSSMSSSKLLVQLRATDQEKLLYSPWRGSPGKNKFLHQSISGKGFLFDQVVEVHILVPKRIRLKSPCGHVVMLFSQYHDIAIQFFQLSRCLNVIPEIMERVKQIEKTQGKKKVPRGFFITYH